MHRLGRRELLLVRPLAFVVALSALTVGPPPAQAAVPPCSSSAVRGGDWTSYGGDDANSRSQPQERSLPPAVAASLSPAWVFSTATHHDAGVLDSTPVESGGCVFVGSSTGRLYAVDARTGTLVWSYRAPVATGDLGGDLVGAPAVVGDLVVVLVNQAGDGDHGPYAVALDRATGARVWRSAPIVTDDGYYTNAGAAVFDGLLFFGFSPPEGAAAGQGGFALLDARTGKVRAVTDTVSPAHQRKGYAGGGIWSTPAYDPAGGYAYVGAGNPYSKQIEDVHTNAILKVDMDPGRSTFGKIVGSYKGNVDQYTSTLQALTQTPACASTADQNFGVDNPVCGQLDLDFGAAPNLFRAPSGRLLVGDLQKSGVYHVAFADTMGKDWTALVGASCQVCNAASTATHGSSVLAVGTPAGLMTALAKRGGAVDWTSPVLDGVHYQSVSTADGVVYTYDGNGFLDAFDAATGVPVLRRPVSADVGTSAANLSSAGVAIADHTVFVAASGGVGAITGGFAGSGGPDLPAGGYLVAYRAPAAS